MPRTPRLLLLVLPLLAAGCADMPLLGRGGDSSGRGSMGGSGGGAAAPGAGLGGPTASVSSLDTVSEADKEAARAAAAAAPAGGELGTVTVSLGSPAESGLWVKSALVSADTPGTVRTNDGKAIAVTLRPLGGAGGPQISLSALQALGLPLVGLHPVTLAAG